MRPEPTRPEPMQVEPRPGGQTPRPRLDAGLRRFARLVLRLVFREVDLIDPGHMPASGPVLLIANHSNSIIDGAVLLAHLPRIPRFLAASTVWDYKPVAPFMDMSGSVKVFRRQDGRAHEGSLEDSFAEAARLLADGGVLAVFPEGRTHDGLELLPFRTGTARIAAFAEERHGPLDLAIVPLGVDYETKTRLRGRVAFSFGPPVRLAGPDGDKHLRAATGRLQAALAAVAPGFDSEEERHVLTLGGEILAVSGDVPGPGSGDAPAPGYGAIVAARRGLQAALAADGDGPAREELRASLTAYARALDQAGLTDSDVISPPGRARLAADTALLLPGLPVLLVALVFNGPQMWLLRRIARARPRDRQMTWMAFGGLVLLPATWGLWALALGVASGAGWGAGWGWSGGGLAAAAALLAAPLSVWLALPVSGRARRLAAGLAAWRRLGRDAALGRRLLTRRTRACEALAAVMDCPAEISA